MARVVGPLHSITASGNFAAIINAATSRGRAYFRRQRRASRFDSELQRRANAKIKALQRLWRTIDIYGGGGNQAAWATDAAGSGLSAYHHYIKSNLARWELNSGPIIRPGFVMGDLGAPGSATVIAGKSFLSVRVRHTNVASPGNGLWIACYSITTTPSLVHPDFTLALTSPINAAGFASVPYQCTRLPPGDYEVSFWMIRQEGTKTAIVTIPFVANPRFGTLLSRRTEPRVVRFGLRVEY